MKAVIVKLGYTESGVQTVEAVPGIYKTVKDARVGLERYIGQQGYRVWTASQYDAFVWSESKQAN